MHGVAGSPPRHAHGADPAAEGDCVGRALLVDSRAKQAPHTEMGNAIWPLFLIVGSNIAYQLSSRGAARGVNPFAALVAAYSIAAVASSMKVW